MFFATFHKYADKLICKYVNLGGGFYTKGVDAIYNSKTLSTGGKSFFDDGQGGLGGSSNGPVASSCHGGFGTFLSFKFFANTFLFLTNK